MPQKKKTYLYKSLSANMEQHGHRFEVGKWYKENDIELCEKGFHASEMALDAMGYVPCEVLAQVEVRGECQKDDDKQVWSEMKIVKTYQWTKEDSVALANYVIKLILPIFEKEYLDDIRCRQAIEIVKQYQHIPNTTPDIINVVNTNDITYEVKAFHAAVYAAKSAVYAANADDAADAAAHAVYAADAAAHTIYTKIDRYGISYVVDTIKKKIEQWIHQRIGF